MKRSTRTNCPNCGAPIQHLYNHQCEYCRTFLNMNVQETEEINPRYLRDVELVYVCFEPPIDSFVLKFKGTYNRYLQPLEYTKNGSFILEKEDIVNKKVYFVLTIEAYEYDKFIREGNFEFIFQILPFEVDKEELIKAIFEFQRKNNIMRW